MQDSDILVLIAVEGERHEDVIPMYVSSLDRLPEGLLVVAKGTGWGKRVYAEYMLFVLCPNASATARIGADCDLRVSANCKGKLVFEGRTDEATDRLSEAVRVVYKGKAGTTEASL